MRKVLFAAAAAAVFSFSIASVASANAQDAGRQIAPIVAGAAVGTTVGLAAYHGWWTSSLGFALPATAAGAAVTGGIAGIGTVVLIDAALQPCKGFHALVGANRGYCAEVNGYYKK